MNVKPVQIMRLVIAVLCTLMIAVQLLSIPGWGLGKILGITAMALTCAAMIISFIHSRKDKDDDEGIDQCACHPIILLNVNNLNNQQGRLYNNGMLFSRGVFLVIGSMR